MVKPPIREWFSWTWHLYIWLSIERSVHFRYVHSIFVCQPFSYFCRHCTLLLCICETVQTVLIKIWKRKIGIAHCALVFDNHLLVNWNTELSCGLAWCEPSSTSQLLIQGDTSSSSYVYDVGRVVCDLFYEVYWLLHFCIIYQSLINLFVKLCPKLLIRVDYNIL